MITLAVRVIPGSVRRYERITKAAPAA